MIDKRPATFIASMLLLFSLAGCVVAGQSVVTTPVPVPPAAEPSPTATVPAPTPAPTAEPDLAATLAAGVEPRLFASYPSPDGAARADVLIRDCTAVVEGQENAYELLHIVAADTGETRFVDDQLLYCGGLGAFGLQGLFWSPDGRYFFYTDAREGGPDGACRPWARPIIRYDMAADAHLVMSQAAISPDGAEVAGWVDGQLVILGPGGDEAGRAAPPPGPPYVGPPVWSAGGTALVYLQFSRSCGETPGESAVVWVDAATQESRVLLTQTGPGFEAVQWAGPERLALTGLLDGGRWTYDIAGDELLPVP